MHLRRRALPEPEDPAVGIVESDGIGVVSHPIVDALAGETHADNVRHAIARSEFLNLLSEDQTVQDRLRTWAEAAGIWPALLVAVGFLECLADYAGMTDRTELLALTGELTLQMNDDTSQNDADLLVREAMAAIDRYMSSIRSSAKILTPLAETFVRDEVGLPWPWLTIELLQMLHLRCLGGFYGHVYQRRIWVEPPDAPAPKVDVRFKTARGETVSAARERLLEAFFAADLELAARTAGARAIPREDPGDAAEIHALALSQPAWKGVDLIYRRIRVSRRHKRPAEGRTARHSDCLPCAGQHTVLLPGGGN